MLKKLFFIYAQHFKFTIALSLFVSVYFILIFWSKGYKHYPLYMVALLFKAIAYGLSLLVEKTFFEARAYHYRNLGFGYRQLFGTLFSLDLLLFACMILLSYLCKSFT